MQFRQSIVRFAAFAALVVAPALSGGASDSSGAHVFARRDNGTNIVSRLVPDGTDVATAGMISSFAQYYPEGNVKSAAEFTSGIKYDAPNTTNRTITVKPFCNTHDSDSDNSGLEGRVVIPPFVDAQGNPYINDNGSRFKVVGVSSRSGSVDANIYLTAIVAPNTVTNTGGNTFAYCTALTTVSFPAATTVGESAFSDCEGLTSVSLPAAITVGGYAFHDCYALTTVSLPAATSIGGSVFEYCYALTSVSLPAATTIGDYAFHDCYALASVDFGDTPRSSVPSLGTSAFDNVPATCEVIVPYTQYDAWIAADGWRDLQQEFVRHAEKADKPATFTTGNLAEFDADGNPVDSGKKPSDFQSALSAQQLANIDAVPGKADETTTVVQPPSLPADCLPITGTYYGSEFSLSTAQIRDDGTEYYAYGTDAGGNTITFALFDKTTGKYKPSEYVIDALKFNGRAPTVNSWPVLNLVAKGGTVVRSAEFVDALGKKVDIANAEVDRKLLIYGEVDDYGNKGYPVEIIADDTGGVVTPTIVSDDGATLKRYRFPIPDYLHGQYYLNGTIALLQNIAGDFNVSTTYAKDALVVHEGALYRCINPAGHKGSWLDADFSRATAEDVLAALRTGKADKAAPSAAGNIAEFDEHGNPVDSGKSLDDIVGTNVLTFAYDVNSNRTAVTVGVPRHNDPDFEADTPAVDETTGEAITVPALVGPHSLAITGDDESEPYIRTVASGTGSIAANKSAATNRFSVALGHNTFAAGVAAVSHGCETAALGDYSHSEGFDTRAYGDYSHVEGDGAFAFGFGAHAEGYNTEAHGAYSHVGGINAQTSVDAWYAHSLGICASATNHTAYVWQGATYAGDGPGHNVTVANYYYSHGLGTYNINPNGGLAGFWVGETNLAQHVANLTAGLAPASRTVNGQSLTNDVRLTAADIPLSDTVSASVAGPGIGGGSTTQPSTVAEALDRKLSLAGGTLDKGAKISWDRGGLVGGSVSYSISDAGVERTQAVQGGSWTKSWDSFATTVGEGHEGNLAALDSQGNPTDSGKSLDDISQEIADAGFVTVISNACHSDRQSTPVIIWDWNNSGQRHYFTNRFPDYMFDAANADFLCMLGFGLPGLWNFNPTITDTYFVLNSATQDYATKFGRITIPVNVANANGRFRITISYCMSSNNGVNTRNCNFDVAMDGVTVAQVRDEHASMKTTSERIVFADVDGAPSHSLTLSADNTTNTCGVVISGVKVDFMAADFATVAPDANAQTGQAADARSTHGQLALKADKPKVFVEGNLVAFDSSGNPTNSGIAKADVVTRASLSGASMPTNPSDPELRAAVSNIWEALGGKFQ